MWSWGTGLLVPGPLTDSEAGTLLRFPGPWGGEELSQSTQQGVLVSKRPGRPEPLFSAVT